MKAYFFLLLAGLSLMAASCKKYLDAKSDKRLVVPATLGDAQALLDNFEQFNGNYPSVAAQADDDYYITDATYNSVSVVNRGNYAWAPDVANNTEWNGIYKTVLAANVALETAEGIGETAANSEERRGIIGSALFFRAFALAHGTQVYTLPYNGGTAASLPGMPLRLNSNTNEPSVRASLEETWRQIIRDFKAASELLPVMTSPVSRPSRPAAFAALARTHLLMGEWAQSLAYADSSLRLYSTLIDYNTVPVTAAIPFARFNAEVLFPARILGTGMINFNNARVDSALFASYASNDLRRTLFFQSNGTGTWGFKGSYDGTGTTSSAQFNGIAVDEVYLVRAESRARLGDVAGAMADLNTLLVKRWKTATFSPLTAASGAEALAKILAERRKELVFRSVRWSDIRRLNEEPAFARPLTRRLNGQLVTLPPGDLRFAFLIPQGVIDLTGMPQNAR